MSDQLQTPEEGTEGTEGTQEGEGTQVTPDHFSSKWGGELSNHPGLAKFETETDLGKSYLEMEQKLSSLGTRVPKEGASPEDLQSYREAIGVPETAAEYKFNENVKVPEGVEWDSTRMNGMVEVMHKIGLTPTQVKELGQAYVDQEVAGITTENTNATEAKGAAEKTLRDEWGTGFDGKIRGANLAMNHLFGDDVSEIATTRLADGSLLGNNTKFLRAMATVGDDYSEHNVHGMADRRRLTKTPEEAKSEIESLKGDNDFQKALWDKEHPGHDAAVNRRDTLYAMAHGGEA
jgi:hypothetical protein